MSMDSDLEDFISHLGEDEPFPGNQQMNALWKEMEEYFDREFLDIDTFLDELLPNTHIVQPLMENSIQVHIPETSAQVSTEEFVKSFVLTESFYNDLIADPKIDFKNLVPTEMLLKSVQSCKTMNNSLDGNYPSASLPCNVASFLPPLRNDVSENIEKKLNSSSNIDLYKILEKIQPRPGITVDSIIENIMRDSTTEEKLPSQEEISISVSSLFKVLNNYIGRLTAEFANHQFFDASQFDGISRKHRNEVLSLSDIQANSLLDILTKWMTTVTGKFAQINDQRRHVEEKVSEKIIDKAVDMYMTKLKSIDRNEEIVLQGIRRVYLNCGVDFNNRMLRELERRLKEVNSISEQSLTSATPEKSDISRPKTHGLNDSSVLIKLLVSEYVSNIKQKALQCAGISTLDQFEDVNKNCLADTMKIFERQMDGVSAAERNDCKKQLKLRLDSESNNKRSEFETLKLSVSPGIPSPYKQTRSHSVGIHFGFETLSVSYLNEFSNTRNIYGPAANLISFTQKGVFIGTIPSEGHRPLNMEQLLKALNVDAVHDTEYQGKLKLEAIIALIFMQIDEMVKLNLHIATGIKYAIAIPSCLNEVMQNKFKVAMNIGNIEGNLVFEHCALSAQFISESHQFVTRNNDEYLINMIEDSHGACDSVVFKMSGKTGKIIEISKISGASAKHGLLSYFDKPGIQFELEKIKGFNDKRVRFLICGKYHEIIKQIKNQFSKAKVHPSKLDSSKLADGAAILSSVADGNPKFQCPFDLRHLTAIKRFPDHLTEFYRLKHYGGNRESDNFQISTKLQRLVDKQSQDLTKYKSSTKQILIGKMKDLEESPFPEHEKQSYLMELENALKAVEEAVSELDIKDIADKWQEQRILVRDFN